MTDEPTLGEIARRLDDIRAQVSTLVSSDVYAAHRDADTQRMTRIEDQVRRTQERSEAQRRWIVGTLIAPLILTLVSYYLATRGVSS